MKARDGYFLIKPEGLFWRPSNLMQIPNADFLERTGSGKPGARLWRLPPKSANTLHKHIRAEEFYFVLEGVGRLRVGDKTLTVPKYGGVLVGPDQLRQVFNDTDTEVLWLILGGPEELEFLQGSKSQMDLTLICPVDPKQLHSSLPALPLGRSWLATNRSGAHRQLRGLSRCLANGGVGHRPSRGIHGCRVCILRVPGLIRAGAHVLVRTATFSEVCLCGHRSWHCNWWVDGRTSACSCEGFPFTWFRSRWVGGVYGGVADHHRCFVRSRSASKT
jgi:mannose-6-phosphate isomerase-like protein (cupin superfamily)